MYRATIQWFISLYKKAFLLKPNLSEFEAVAGISKNIEEFKERVFEEVKKIHITRFPYNDFLYEEYVDGN